MSDAYPKIIELITASDPVAALAELAKLAAEHAGNPAAAKLVDVVTNYLQGVVNENARKAFADALVESKAFELVPGTTRVVEKLMPAGAYMFCDRDIALVALGNALATLPNWREKAAHDALVERWARAPHKANVGAADAAVPTYEDRIALREQSYEVGGDVGFPLSDSLKAAEFSASWVRQITYDTASGVLAAGRSPEGFAAMVAAAAPGWRTRALNDVVLMLADFPRLTSANPGHDFVTFADLRIGSKAVLIAFGYLRDSPDFHFAATRVMKFMPMFEVFGAQVVAKALADAAAKPPGMPGESVALRVGNATSKDYAGLERLWDTAQKHWNDENPNRLSDEMFRPIYSIPEWMVNQVDYQEVNQYISQAKRISWAPSA